MNGRDNPAVAMAARLDVSHDGTHPTIVVQAADGVWHAYPVVPKVAAAIIKKLAVSLQLQLTQEDNGGR